MAQGGQSASSKCTYLSTITGLPAHYAIVVHTSLQLHGLAPIPAIDFSTLLKDPKLAHWHYEHYRVSGIYVLDVDLRDGQQLGEGAMKTAHDGKLTGSHHHIIDSSEILQRLATGKPICVKYFYCIMANAEYCPYTSLLELTDTYHRGKMLRAHFQGSYEFKRICTEANIHFWACVLMQMVYTFIESQRAAESESLVSCLTTCSYVLIDCPPPPANIPQFRYVAAAVCTTAKDNLVPYHSFMIEERIAIPEDAHFIKWIHNGSPNPVASIDQNHPEYDKAQFLSAAQHLQYVKTRGSAYVADFQGYGYQLTDAQIMTSP